MIDCKTDKHCLHRLECADSDVEGIFVVQEGTE